MKKITTDAATVASKQKHEMQYVCRVWKDADGKHLTKAALKTIMAELGKNGKPCRSRVKIYTVLRAKGYVFCAK